ncbi:MAG: tRNA pseudouridine synthase A [Lachnospiraceae bacterium]|jgi:tRNA pseudouridine38-40 synthase|nr:tRNA pseudouridine synthase A [Lachnospiraceae bacterium]
MRNIKLKLEYDGSRYVGWIRLGKDEGNNTVSSKILEVIKKMTGENILELNCGMRTEVGVHAYEQVCNFKTNSDMTLIDMKHYMNRYLPMDIAVTDIQIVPEKFHASLNAISRTYIYQFVLGETPNIFERKYSYHLFKEPDVEAIKIASDKLKGSHDFKNFSSSKKNKSTVRKITNIEIYKTSSEMQITITADDFLHNMAKMIFATLVDIGLGVKTPDTIDKIFAGEEVPSKPIDPRGMFLQHVGYIN